MAEVELDSNELNLLVSAVGLALNMFQNNVDTRTKLEALQTKLMDARDKDNG